MARWLVKSDPDGYAWSDLVRDRRTVWNGVANALALRHLAAMRAGEECLVYESGAVKAVVGRARVVSDPYPDPQAGDPRRLVVDLEAAGALAAPVPLARLRTEPVCVDFPLVRQPRLSVMPVPAAVWRRLLALGRG